MKRKYECFQESKSKLSSGEQIGIGVGVGSCLLCVCILLLLASKGVLRI